MIRLSTDQKKVLDKVLAWYQKGHPKTQYLTLGGYAGTGKTTLIAILRRRLAKDLPNLQVGFASYTGRAARVLRTKLKEEKVLKKQDSVGTIHSLIYTPIVNDREEIVGWEKKEKIEPSLIIIDEASMVDELIWSHLTSYGVPIIAVGDHGQLPPIRGRFSLMAKPHLVLEKIHRQVADHPIINLSIEARQKGLLPIKNYGLGVEKFSLQDEETQEVVSTMLGRYNRQTLVLCGYNRTRKKLNQFIRQSLGFNSPEPVVGERVICLRNNHTKMIFNGMLGTLLAIKKKNDDWYKVEILMDGEKEAYRGQISVAQFGADSALNYTSRRSRIMKGDLFDFGYALTVHKAQGSQAKKVILFEERFSKMDDQQWRRWLYTGVTRAQEELYIFG